MTHAVETESGADRPKRVRRIGVLVVVASFIGIWGYVMYLSFFVGRQELRDHLDETEWVQAAETACAPTATAVAQEPYANQLSTPAERAAVLDDATAKLETMVQHLRALPPPAAADEARAVSRWLDDWEEYNRNRRAYADRFRAGFDEPFRVTDRGGYQIDVLIDDFAETANDMPSCATPEDVG